MSSKLAIADELLTAVEAAKDAPADERAEVKARAERIQEEAHAGYLRSQVLDAARANAAFVACGLGHPGDAEVEAWLLDASDDELHAAVEAIEYATWGDDPEGFFARLARTTAGRMLSSIVKARAKKEAETAAASASTTTSTRTAGTASSRSTPPTSPPQNRKACRAAKPKPRARKPART
ncbi:hypothetical protein OKC48_16185 [Methylorubrum extorquens]|uniref:hypothetical protein n=1 Tax=Methylorubrum extorquens TaxID=408 RepID=UPI0022388C8E|nr:hypothetical protein [Methylorubrum extorquens]UYW24812.1 hypothetical protein OKC48_16185 [Methylorubrum extorquens]